MAVWSHAPLEAELRYQFARARLTEAERNMIRIDGRQVWSPNSSGTSSPIRFRVFYQITY